MPDLNTTNLNFVQPEVNASDGTWGTKINANWGSLDGILWGSTAIRPNLATGNWQIGGVAVTATAANLNNIAGVTASSAEINHLVGVTSGVQSQLNAKAPLASPAFTGTPTAPTAVSGTSTTQVATTAFVQNAVAEATGGVDLSAYMVRANNLSDLTSAVTARQNLGGTATGISLFTAATAAAALSALGITVSAANINQLSGISGNVQAQINALSGASSVPTTRLVSTGGGLSGGGDLSLDRTISHADTSSQASVNNSGTTVIQDVTLDTYGHVTGLNSVALSIPAAYSDASARSAQAGHSAGAVGSYAFLRAASGTSSYNPGDTLAGSSLDYASADGGVTSTTSPAGTWRCMGRGGYNSSAGIQIGTLWLRIS